MATAGAKEVDCNLFKVRTLKLEADRNREYTGLVVLADMLMVVDNRGYRLRLHRLSDGKLLATSNKLQSWPFDVCLVGGTQVVVTLDKGQIEFLSVEPTSQPAALRLMRTLNVTKGFDNCHGVRAFRSGGNLVVSGVRRDKDTGKTLICWGLVSLVDENVGPIRKICKGFWSYLATSPDDSTVYISCNSGDSNDTGVYGFDVRIGSQKFVYRRNDLKYPRGISVDTRGYIYVCNNLNPPCIHQLTEGGEPVTVHKEGMPLQPWGIYWEEQQEGLYVTSLDSEIWRFRMEWSNQQGDHIAREVLVRDERKQPVTLETVSHIEQGIQNMDLVREISSGRRALPPGTKYHVFFSYSSSDMQWVKQTVERLETEHGFVCREYERDNTAGTPLLQFVSDSIKNAYKTVIVMTQEAFQSGFVLHEIDMAMIHGFNERRDCVVPVLLDDCEIPFHLSVLNYVDARDSNRRDVWWPKLLFQLKT